MLSRTYPTTIPLHSIPISSSLGYVYFLIFAFGSLSVNAASRSSPCDKWDTCSQNCDDGINNGTFVCSCLEEFHLSEDNRTCFPNEPAIRILYALKSSIRMVDITSKKHYSIVENKGQTVGVAVDVRGGYIFWTDVTEGKESVHRLKINGEGPIETIVDTGLLLPEGIAFDWVTGNIYIADSNRSHIVVCKGDGQVCTVLIRQLMMDKPREIALHPNLGLMFWTDWGEKSSIMRANMDGSYAVPIVTEDIKWPNSLAVDHGNNRIYWIDAFYHKIETSKLTGKDRQLVNAYKVNHPFSLEIFGDLVFWSDWELKEIQSCTKFNCKSDIRTVIKTTADPNGIAIIHAAAQPRINSNACKSKCSHICVLSGNSGYSCKCPAGFKLDDTKKNCIDDETKPKMLIGHDDKIKIFRFESIGRDLDILEETKIADLKSIGAIVYNPINETIFISDLTWKSIFEYSFSKRTLTTLSNRHLDAVKSMTLDPVGENLYWVDSSRRKIEVMSCRTGAKALIAMEADHPQSIIAVPEERYLFIALTGRRGGRILRMNMNGYNRRTLARTNHGEPISLTYNSELRRVFWIDGAKSSIEHISINGRSQQVTAERSGTPFGLTNFGNRIFWSDRSTQLLHSMAVFGMDQKESPVFIGHPEDLYNNSTIESYVLGNFLAKLAIIYKDSTKYENLTKNHECSTGKLKSKCSHICLISADLNIGTCVCPEGMQLNNDGTTCSWTSTCLKTQFQCNDKHCIDADWRCDGSHDCPEGEDELNCQQVNVCSGETSFLCQSDQSCIHTRWRCDGERDCPNGEDEFNCDSHPCPETEFQCKNGRCLPKSWKCDNQIDCPTGEDEQNCNATCPIGSFQCKKDHECIIVDWVCDGESDCRDGSDEHEHCDTECSHNSFRCLDHHCIHGNLVCNGVYDCADNSDEFDCNITTGIHNTLPPILTVFERNSLNNYDDPDIEIEEVTSRPKGNNRDSVKVIVAGSFDGLYESCPWDHFTCFSGECLPFSKVCDNLPHCIDGSDEGSQCDTICKENECPHQCLRTPSGTKCLCNPGYDQDKRNKRGCVDINECLISRPCEHTCINTRGSFKCTCHDDYALRSDQRRCKPKSKGVKPHYIRSDEKVETINSEESLQVPETTSHIGSSAGWWVFGLLLILILVGGIIGFVLHRKQIHPKILFQRYAHHIPVKFSLRRNQARRESTGDEETYQDFSDGRRSSSDHAGLLSNIDASI